jgi:hypothetical protein
MAKSLKIPMSFLTGPEEIPERRLCLPIAHSQPKTTYHGAASNLPRRGSIPHFIRIIPLLIHVFNPSSPP